MKGNEGDFYLEIIIKHNFEKNKQTNKQTKKTVVYLNNHSPVLLRGGFKTQPPVDRRFRPVPGGCHCLEQ